MGDVSDIEELLGKHRRSETLKAVWSAFKFIAVLASAFGGAAWTARGYLEQLATKDDVALLLRGQDEKLDRIDARLTALGDRQTRTETRVEDLRGTMTVRPR